MSVPWPSLRMQHHDHIVGTCAARRSTAISTDTQQKRVASLPSDTSAWLSRIGLDPQAISALPRDLDLLQRLHCAHVRQIPFENLDIHLSRPIALTIPALQAKLVDAGRGGFCYELNGLFAHHLRALGYSVTLLNGRYRRAGDTFGPDFDHLALLVDIADNADRWLCDVGSFLHPLPLSTQEYRQPDGEHLRLLRDTSRNIWILQTADAEGWQPQFCFDLDLQPHDLSEFAAMCHVQCTSPDSHFTHGRLCSSATPTGRVSLSENRLIVTEAGARHETPITSNAEFEAALLNTFGIDLRGAHWQPPHGRHISDRSSA